MNALLKKFRYLLYIPDIIKLKLIVIYIIKIIIFQIHLIILFWKYKYFHRSDRHIYVMSSYYQLYIVKSLKKRYSKLNYFKEKSYPSDKLKI